jgi:hypothetical protein
MGMCWRTGPSGSGRHSRRSPRAPTSDAVVSFRVAFPAGRPRGALPADTMLHGYDSWLHGVRFLAPWRAFPGSMACVSWLHGVRFLWSERQASPGTCASPASSFPSDTPDPPGAGHSTTSLPQRPAPDDIVATTTSLPAPPARPPAPSPAGSLQTKRTNAPLRRL